MTTSPTLTDQQNDQNPDFVAPSATPNSTTSTETDFSATPLAWLTGEAFLYLLLVVAALGARFGLLNAYPFGNGEAAQALVGLTVFQGDIPAEAANYSPLLVTLNSLAFLLFGVSDTTARLAAILLGMVLVLLPLGLRRQLGVMGAFVASVMFAFSASSLFWSRQNTGDIAVAVGIMLVLVGSLNWDLPSRSWPLFMLIAGSVMLLISAPAQFTALIILLLVVAFVSFMDADFWPQRQRELAQIGLTLGQVGLWAGGLLVLLGTTALFNLTGLAAISDLFTAWLGQFSFTPQPAGTLPALLLLIFYEPVILLFAIVGIILSFVERRPFDQALVIGFGCAILLDLVMSGRSSGQILVPLVPLILLASRPLGLLFVDIKSKLNIEGAGLFVSFGLVLSTFIYISLTGWLKCPVGQPDCNTAIILPLAGLGLILVLFFIFRQWYNAEVAWQGLGILAVLVIGSFTIGSSWRLNFGPLKDRPLQPMVSEVPSTRFVSLLNDINRISEDRRAEPTAIDGAIIGLNQPMVQWYLRDFEQVFTAAGFSAAQGQSIILAPASAGQPIEGGYAGQDYALTSQWQPTTLAGKELFRWYLFRVLPHQRPLEEAVVLWVRNQ